MNEQARKPRKRETILLEPPQKASTALEQTPWFQRSPHAIQTKLRSLGEEWAGMVNGLTQLPVEQNGHTLWNLESLDMPQESAYGASLQWRIQQPNGETRLRQCFSWRRGNPAGGKGVILIRSSESPRITQVLTLRGMSVPVWEATCDCVGGGLHMGETPEQCFRRETAEETGIKDFLHVGHLGYFHPDQSFTPMRADLFAGMISKQTFRDQVNLEHTNILGDLDGIASIQVTDVEDLWGKDGFIMKNPDSYFQACMSRLVALGVLEGPRIRSPFLW